MPNIMQDLGTKIGSEFKTHRLRIEAVETDKQENLVSGTNIKTINGTSVLGSGDIVTTQTTISGNAGTATKLQTARNIALTGDVTGNANFDGSGNISITAAIAANSVALGTDTTGNYVAGNTAGTGITVTGTAGEGWSPTITLSNVGTAGTYTKITTNAQGQVTSGSTLTNSDIPSLDASKITTGTIDSARLPSFVDDVLEFANLAGFPTTGEAGKIYIALDTNKTYRWSGSTYIYIPSGAVDSVAGKTGTVSLVKDDVGLSLVDNTADATKNVLSATKWTTARTIALVGDVTGSASIDGSANVTITTTTVQPNSVALGTDTTGNYVAGVTAGQGITISGTAGEGWSPTIALSALDLTLFPTSNFKKSVKVATTANITLSGVQTIDGISVVAGDRVLVKNQTTASQNGIYIVDASTWTRSVAAGGANEIVSAVVGVDQGTTNGGRFFTNTFKTTDTVGTTAMPWYEVATTSSTVSSANTLATARTISGVSFNGSANIDIEDRLGTAIASATTTTVGTRGLGDYIHITGTTTITSFGTAAAAGVRRTLIFDGALTLTHNATSLICPGDANIVTVAGTIIEVVAETTANWRVVSITHPSLSIAELGYLNGVTSDIQTQLNAKAALASPALTGTPTAPTAAVGTSTTQIASTAFVNAEIANDTYSKAQLDAGQLDNRYYTEVETNLLLGTKVDDTEIASVNLLRADKYLAAQAVANMVYSVEGKLSKVQYNNATDVDYEVLTYNGSGKLSNVAHYTTSVLRGNTVLSYSAGKLVSAIYTGV